MANSKLSFRFQLKYYFLSKVFPTCQNLNHILLIFIIFLFFSLKIFVVIYLCVLLFILYLSRRLERRFLGTKVLSVNIHPNEWKIQLISKIVFFFLGHMLILWHINKHGIIHIVFYVIKFASKIRVVSKYYHCTVMVQSVGNI